MIFSKNIFFIIFLSTCFGIIMSDEIRRIKCLDNIYSDFDYVDKKPHSARQNLPRRAYLEKVVDDFTSNDAKFYYEHLQKELIPKENMQSPSKFCDNQTKFFAAIKSNEVDRRVEEYRKCVGLLSTMYSETDDNTIILRDIFWRFKESFFTNYDVQDYRKRYYYHLSSKFHYPRNHDKKLPLTPIEFCSFGHPYIGLVSNNEKDASAEQIETSCASKICLDFGYTALKRNNKIRHVMTTLAFLNFVERDLESPAKDYFNHIYSVIKEKEGTENPREYCYTLTRGLYKLSDDMKLEEERKCVGYLFSMFRNSDATTVIRDAFWNFKATDYINMHPSDYRYRYFYYLSGNFDFYDVYWKTPLTPNEFCSMGQSITHSFKIHHEPTATLRAGEGSSSSNRRIKVTSIGDLI